MPNWGIIGASGIARVFCNGLQFSKTGRLAAVASRTPGKADTLADLFDCQTRYHSYEDLLADDTIDVVYVSNIHLGHAEAVIMAAKAGKHILVEKPIAMNAGEAAEMIEAARANDVFLMEAFMYRCHPQIARMVELIQSGAVGEVLMVRSTFGFYTPFDAHSRVRDKALGGGGILEVGCYPASIARLIAGAAVDRPFLDPIEVKASGALSATGVDLYTAGTLKFENDIVVEIAAGVGCNIPASAVIYGSDSILSVQNPWLPSTPSRTAKRALPLDTKFPSSYLTLQKQGESSATEIEVEADRDLFSYEANMVGEHIEARQAPAMPWNDSLGNMTFLDAWLAEVGVVYE